MPANDVIIVLLIDGFAAGEKIAVPPGKWPAPIVMRLDQQLTRSLGVDTVTYHPHKLVLLGRELWVGSCRPHEELEDIAWDFLIGGADQKTARKIEAWKRERAPIGPRPEPRCTSEFGCKAGYHDRRCPVY